MCPVPTSNYPTVGFNSNFGTGAAFDPIAARDPDRPKFRLDDYEEKAPREPEPQRAASKQQSAADSTGENHDTASEVAPSATDRPQAGKDTQAGNDEINTFQSDSEQNITLPIRDNNPDDASADAAAAHFENAPTATPGQTPNGSVRAAPQTQADASDQDASSIASSEQDNVTPLSATATQQPVTETPVAANGTSNELANSTSAVKATTAAATVATSATAAAHAMERKAETTSSDPKLAALEKLTKADQSASAASSRIAPGDDKTAFKLPVPWPPLTHSEQTQKSDKQSSASSAAHTGSKTNGETAAKIEIIAPAPAKPAATSDTLLFANNRTGPSGGPSSQTVFPTPGETIAAATALNSRATQSNALGGTNIQRSNAVTASNDSNGSKITTNPVQQNPAMVSPVTQPVTAAATTAATAPAQSAVTAPEQLAPARQQATMSQRGHRDQSGTPSSPSRPPDLLAQSNGNGFAETLKTVSVDRTAAPQGRQTLPTPATEQVKVKLFKAAQGGLDKIKIQLNPSELGKVEVRLEIGSDGAVRGTVIADKPETMDLLQRDAKQLERALQDAGLKTGGDSLDFQMRGGDTNERQQQAGSGNGPLSKDGGDLDGGDEQPVADTSGSERDGIGDDGSLNLVA